MKIAQILNNKVHWIFISEKMPNFPPDPEGNSIILIDITNNPEVQEGWDYKELTGEFIEPKYIEPEDIIIEPTIQEEILYETKYQTMLLEMGGM